MTSAPSVLLTPSGAYIGHQQAFSIPVGPKQAAILAPCLGLESGVLPLQHGRFSFTLQSPSDSNIRNIRGMISTYEYLFLFSFVYRGDGRIYRARFNNVNVER